MCDCLSIFTGVDCSMKMIYKGDGAPLVFVLEQHGDEDLVTECSIRTKHSAEPLDFVVDSTDDGFNTLIVRGADFASLLGEIDRSADELEIHMAPEAPHFRLSSLGVVQSEWQVEVARTSDMMLRFVCKCAATVRYKMSHIRITMKALALAAKVALRTDGSGLLGMQMMVLAEEASAAQIYVEFFVMPLLSADDMM